MSREVDTSTAGKVDLVNASSTDIIDLQGVLNTKFADIITNAADIATNVTDIGTNASNIATNVTNIATNVTDIGTNVTNIGTNTTNIGTNTTNIGTNTTDIGTNVTNIGTNTTDIGTNVTAIGLNTSKVSADGSIDTHSDVDTSSVAPTDLQVMTYINATSMWEPRDGGSGGGGAGGINYVINPGYEENVDNVTVTGNINKSQNAVDNLRDAKSLELEFTTSVTVADHADFLLNPIDNQDLGKVLNISFDFATDANYTADDIEFVMRDTVGAVDIPISNGNDGKLVATGLFTNRSKFVGRFQTDSTNLTYELRAKVLVAPSSNSKVLIDNVVVGPDVLIPGSIIGTILAFTPTHNNFSIGNGTQAWEYQRIGSQLYVNGTVTWGSTTSLSGAWTIDNPIPGTTMTQLGSKAFSEGIAAMTDSSTPANNEIGTIQIASGAIRPLVNGGSDIIDATTPFTWASGDRFSMKASFQINEWSSGAMLSTTENLFASAKLIATRITSGQAIPSGGDQDIIFNSIGEEVGGSNYNTSTGIYTCPKTGFYFAACHISLSAVNTASTLRLKIKHEGTTVAQDQETGSTTNNTRVLTTSTLIKCIKGDEINATVLQNTGTDKDVQTAISGLSIYEVPDFSVFSVFGETELLEASSGFISYPITVDEWGNLTSMPMPPGTWSVSGLCETNNSGGSVTTTRIFLGISTTDGDSTTGMTDGVERTGTSIHTTGTSGRHSLAIPDIEFTFSETTTLYLKGRAETSLTNLQVGYRLSATRIK